MSHISEEEGKSELNSEEGKMLKENNFLDLLITLWETCRSNHWWRLEQMLL
jgi:hypothetical protein